MAQGKERPYLSNLLDLRIHRYQIDFLVWLLYPCLN